MKFVTALLAFLLLQALDAHAATFDVSTGGSGSSLGYACTDESGTRECTCSGEADCDRLQASGNCTTVAVWDDAPPHTKWVPDLTCEGRQSDRSCTCTWDSELAGVSRRPGYVETDGADVTLETEEAVRPTELVPMTSGVMFRGGESPSSNERSTAEE